MNSIYIKNARVNNLKNISLHIQRNKLVVITGVSGSGKSSLAFDTLYAEGQRRYVESLSSYARQFLERMEKPDVDYIQGISPAMAIQQKVSTSNPRSTVGTVTEIYDYLKLLFARAGKTYSPVSGKLVTHETITDVVDFILQQKEGSKILIYTDVAVRSKGYQAELELTLQKGFTRILEGNEITDIEDLIEQGIQEEKESFRLLVDRCIVNHADAENLRGRLGDSIQTAYQEGHGGCNVVVDKKAAVHFSEKFEADGMEFELPSVDMFSFNNPYGACKTCSGFGRVLGIDEDLVLPDKSKSVYEGLVAPWRGEVMGEYQKEFIQAAESLDFPIHKPYFELSEAQQNMLWEGTKQVWGINRFFKYIESKLHKIQYRVLLSRYRGYTICPDCKGSRIRKDANYVKVGGYSISDFLFRQLDDLRGILETLELDEREQILSKRILHEIHSRLDYLIRAGVGYLSLNRKINTLSGGEMQRIRLATSLGSGLVGSMYILDEPSIGLHPRDTDKLVTILESLRNQGNTVVVVEHDESVMRKADQLVDLGPGAGEFGGEIVFNGIFEDILKSDTLTGRYLTGVDKIPVPEIRRKKRCSIRIEGARLHNLQNLNVEIPLYTLTLVTGVSGSGKSTLIQSVLYPALRRHLGEFSEKGGHIRGISGDMELIRGVEMVDQRPVGRSSRSNPATYLKVYDAIRELFADQPLAKVRDLKPGSFSFNVEGGRCEACKGEGNVTVEMQFLPDVELLCEVCQGKRFQQRVLEVNYRDKNIYDILNMTISEAMYFFQDIAKIKDRLLVLDKVGLGYLRMGQSTSTLSGGEAQRMKLASFLSMRTQDQGTFFIFDEPTTGLHFDDIKKLLVAMNELVEMGNTVLVIEHNLEVIKCADWIIDLGPEGGDKGGQLVFQGTPEALLENPDSYTARYLKEKLPG
jgi:excinuclease ABC subunit A